MQPSHCFVLLYCLETFFCVLLCGAVNEHKSSKHCRAVESLYMMGRCYRSRRRFHCQQKPVCNLSHTVVEFNKWFRSNCKDSPEDTGQSLRLAHFSSTGRGLMATRPIQPKSTLISIPLRLLITRAKADVGLRDILNIDANLPTHHLLAVFLMTENGKSSASSWEPYLKTIPQSYDVPFFCSNNEMLSLPEKYIHFCDAQRNVVINAYRLVRSKVIRKDFIPNFDDFCWAWFSVNTRAVFFPVKDSRVSEMALAPLLDMFNHTAQVQVQVGVFPSSSFDEGVYKITSTNTGYKKYDQVFINYGPHDNLKLCFEYGFTLNDNPNDTVPINLEDLTRHIQLQGDNLLEPALKMIKSHNLNENLSIGYLSSDHPLSWNVSACLFILTSSNNPESWQEVFSTDIQARVTDSPDTRGILFATIQFQIDDIDRSLAVQLESVTSSYKVLRNLLEMHRYILHGAKSFLCG